MKRFVPASLARRGGAAALLLVAVTMLGACSEPAAPPAPPAEKVEMSALGLAVAALPASFRVVRNDGDGLVLAPTGEGATGELILRNGASDMSPNLVQACNDHKVAIEARPGGVYKGQREMVTPLGSAFYSRGRYADAAGAEVEETTIFALHPDGERLTYLTYTYPAAEDSGARLEALFEVLGEVEPLATTAETE